MIKVIYALIFAAIFVIALFFSLKNLQPVSINLFIGTFSMPLALALTIELLAGVAIGLAVQFTYVLRLKTANGRLRKQLAVAEQEIEDLHTHGPSND